MAIKNIAILGNTFTAKVIALSLKINNPQCNPILFTNNENFRTQIISNQYLPTAEQYSFPTLLFKHCNISVSDIFSQTKSTVGHGISFEGLKENEIIFPARMTQLQFSQLNYYCTKYDFLKFDTTEKKYQAFIEYLIQKNKNILDVFTIFPYDLYSNNENLYHLTGKFLTEGPPGPLWFRMPGCYDLDNICALLDNKISELTITIIPDSIINSTAETISVLDAKNIKNITHITTNNQSFDIDLVINTGIDNLFFNNFIESEKELVTTNPTIIFSGYEEEEMSFIEPAIYNNQLLDNNFVKIVKYKDYSQKITFNNNVSNLNTLQNNFLINDTNHSNYIEFNLEKLGLNPMLNEELIVANTFIDSIISTASSSIIDPANVYQYIGTLQYKWENFNKNLKKFGFYLLKNTTLQGYESFKNTPEIFNTNFANKVPNFSVDFDNEITFGNSYDKDPYSAIDYIIAAAQLGNITAFDFDFSNSNIFDRLALYLEINVKENFYFNGYFTFEEFLNLIILETPNYGNEGQITSKDGEFFETYIEYVPFKRVRASNNGV